MKKAKIIKAILSPIAKGLAIFAIFGLAVYVYGAVTFPTEQPNTTTGVVGMFVGLTSDEYDTGVLNYADLNKKCDTGTVISPISGSLTNVGAHVCTSMEIQNSYNNSSPAILAQTTGLGIINQGPPGYVVYANDCNGWTARTKEYLGSPAFGAVWYFDSKNASLVRCDWLADTAAKDFKIACCK